MCWSINCCQRENENCKPDLKYVLFPNQPQILLVQNRMRTIESRQPLVLLYIPLQLDDFVKNRCWYPQNLNTNTNNRHHNFNGNGALPKISHRSGKYIWDSSCDSFSKTKHVSALSESFGHWSLLESTYHPKPNNRDWKTPNWLADDVKIKSTCASMPNPIE